MMHHPQVSRSHTGPLTGVRSSKRIPVVLKVEAVGAPSGVWTTVNVSEGGMFLSGAPVLSRGSSLRLRWSLRDEIGTHVIESRAQVMWANDPAHSGGNRRLPPGMGVSFVSLDPASQRILRNALYGAASVTTTYADSVDTLEPGTILGSYRILALLGAGGMASVYVAEHLSLGRKVALKRLHPHFAKDQDAVRRFFHEGRMVNRVRHDNIVQVTDFISEGPEKYYVMELLEGESLASACAREGRLPIERVVSIGVELCDALQAVHEAGIVHRDLKPANIFLARRSDGQEQIKLLDFGVAKLQEPERTELRETLPGIVVGTPGYMAPEYGQGLEFDHRADIYVLGAILYELVAGQMLFEDQVNLDSWAELLTHHVTTKPPLPSQVTGEPLPFELETVIMRCLEKNPARRPQSALELKQALQACVEDVPEIEVVPIQASFADRIWFAFRRLYRLALVAALVLAIGLVAVAGFRLLQTNVASNATKLPAEARPAVVAPSVDSVSPAQVAPEQPRASEKPARVKASKRKAYERRGTIDPFGA